MTAVNAGSVAGVHVREKPLLLGFGPVFRKELREWLASRRALFLFLVTTLITELNTLGPRLTVMSAQASGRSLGIPVSLDPTFNVVAKWDEWVFVFAIFAAGSLVVGERDRGTLAWSLSKPLSRSALLLAKWCAAMIVFTIAGIVLPMLLCVAAAIPAYGMPDLHTVLTITVLLTATPAFFIALSLAAGTFMPSQIGVTGLAVVVAVVPGIIGQVLPDVAAFLPPSIGPWALAVATGGAAPLSTPLGWAVGVALAAVVGYYGMQRADF